LGQRKLLRCAILASFVLLAPLVYAQDVSIKETPQQANERIKSLSEGAKTTPHDYIIGSGDLLGISVFDVPDLSRDVRVSQTGTIGIPLVPVRLRVAGLTELQTEQKIAEVLEVNGLVSHPEVGVAVKEHKSKPITVVGAVPRPMVYEADHTVTLLEVLAQAGGIANDAGDTVIISRQHSATFVEIADANAADPAAAPGTGEPPELNAPPSPSSTTEREKTAATSDTPAFPSATQMAEAASPAAPTTAQQAPSDAAAESNLITINLNELLEKGNTRNNIPLQAGDIVTVPHAGIVYVLGAVNRPGGFVVSNDRTQLTTLKILSLAGGLTKIAKVSHAVIIRKDDQGKQTETEVDLKKVLQRQSEDLAMRASDILYIPDDRTKEVLLRAVELGVALGSAVSIYRLAYH